MRSTETQEAEAEADAGGNGVGSYVYGIVPGDVEVTPGTKGVGDPPGQVELLTYGEIGALVSDVPVDRPLGRPKDLQRHAELLDDTAAEVPVLPLRFGAVLTSPEAVVEELLTPYHDEFRDALEELEGRAEYVIKARYVERAILLEVLDENKEAARLRKDIHGRPEELTRNARMRLGEIIEQTIAAKRELDTDTLLDEIENLSEAVVIREPTHERDAAHIALLMESDRRAELEQVLDELRDEWAGRVEIRLLGPLAPYDFVGTTAE
ncbi:GvpL/GvpF family gas vesicle protein [Nonomuraea cavernae]|nr:GvpL/GvpF family gas vesicle protein [Nonomuraea cavernae]MCA2189827.1 GvpL/GvpF family gas vesicle protein [Nonomuraea cavernae]